LRKQELIEALNKYLMTGKVKIRGQRPFAEFLVDFLEKLWIPVDEKYAYKFWKINADLPQIIIDAFEELRTGDNQTTEKFRQRYELETGSLVPEILNINAVGNSDARIDTIKKMLQPLMNEAIGEKWNQLEMEKYCFEQDHLLQSVFDNYIRHVYRKGMRDLISNCPARGMNGEFGSAKVSAYSHRGQTQIQFLHADGQQHVTFIITNDSIGLAGKIQAVYTDIKTGCAMINEVIQNWPIEKESQEKLFVPYVLSPSN
jgi:hypothetical protein